MSSHSGFDNFLTEELMSGCNWRAFERAIARVLSHCGWEDVQVVGRAGDGGADVLGIRRTQNNDSQIYVIQVKAVTGSNYVGPAAIDEAINALQIYGGDVAVVATNGEFTKSAFKRKQELERYGYTCKLWNGSFLLNLLSMSPSRHWRRRDLRNYQERVVDAVLKKYQQGGKTAQFIVATGLGKSTIAAEIAVRLNEFGLTRTLVLCHSQDLCYQLEQSFWSQINKEVTTHVFMEGAPPNRKTHINFGTYQTMINYLSGFDKNAFDIIIVDEAHHSMAGGFLRCINHFTPSLLIGMTATPWRGDGLDLNTVFGEPVERVSLVDGMKMGYLAKASYRLYYDKIDWEELSKSNRVKISISDLNKKLFMPQRDETIIAETIKVTNEIKDPHVIFFCPSIEHGYRIAELANATGILSCQPLSGVDRAGRYKTLMEFSAGRINAVTAVDVLNEGIDVPDVNIIVFLRATHSRRIFIQQLGRGLRIAQGKTEVKVLDFVADIRRIAEAIRMDVEAKSKNSDLPEAKDLYFPEGLVDFSCDKELKFAQQWVLDIADLENNDNAISLLYPVGGVNEENT